MSSPQHLRSGSMFLMIATMICGVLAVLILLPSVDRFTGFKLPSKPSPQTSEAFAASEKLSRVFTEFREPSETQRRSEIREVSSARSNSTVIARTAHADASEHSVSKHSVSDAPNAQAIGYTSPESPQVYVPVTVHPVTVNIDNGSLTAEVSRLTAAMERLTIAPEQRTSSETETQAEILEIRKRLDEINVTLAGLRAQDQQVTQQQHAIQAQQPTANPGSEIQDTARPDSETPAPTENAAASAPSNAGPNPFEELVNDEVRNDSNVAVTEPEPVEFPEDNPFSQTPVSAETPAPAETSVPEVPSLPAFSEPLEEPSVAPVEEPADPQPVPELEPELPALPQIPDELPTEEPATLQTEQASDDQQLSDQSIPDQSIPELTIPVPVYEDQSLRTDPPLPTIPVSLPQQNLPQQDVPQNELEHSTSVRNAAYPMAVMTEVESSGPGTPYPTAEHSAVPRLEPEPDVTMSTSEPNYELPPLMVPEEEMRHYPHSRPAPRKKSLFPQGFDYDLMDLPTPKLPKLSKLEIPKLPKPNIRMPRLPNWEALTNPDPDVPQWVDQLRDSDPLAPVRESPSVHRGLSALRFAGSSRTVD